MNKGKLKKIVIKSFMIMLILIVAIYWLVGIYSLIFEQDKIAVDRYNFEELSKSKQTLDKVKTSDRFDNLNEFNNLYGINIKPIKNCYYLSDNNWEYTYLFWFQLESLIYKFLYLGKNYTYPSFDLPKDVICFGDWHGGNWWLCEEINHSSFIRTISNPCKN